LPLLHSNNFLAGIFSFFPTQLLSFLNYQLSFLPSKASQRVYFSPGLGCYEFKTLWITGPVSVTAFSPTPSFLTRLIFPELLKHSLLAGLVYSIIKFFLGPGDPPLIGNFVPL
jgi:hypothetical protein